MPVSSPYNIPWVINVLRQLNPKTILDIGIGLGAYGFVCREYLEIPSQRLLKKQWNTIIDGIEIFENYKNPIWDYFYDKIIIGDVREVINEFKNYDVVLILDVIEHLSKEDGYNLLEKILRISKYIIITTPNTTYPQNEMFGNPHEIHSSEWRAEDFKNFHNKVVKVYDCDLIILTSTDDGLNSIDLQKIPKIKKIKQSKKINVIDRLLRKFRKFFK